MGDAGLTIGGLAAAAGVSVRTVRHYHAVGLLEEPARGVNGYRRYGPDALLRLLRIRRHVAEGLPLAAVARVLDAPPDGGDGLAAVLTDVAEALRHEEEQVRTRRAAVLAALAHAREPAPSAADGLVAELERLGYPAPAVRAEAEVLRLLELAMPAERFAAVARHYRSVLAGPDARRALALHERFEALAAAPPGAPEVAEVAAAIRALADRWQARPAPGAGAAPDPADGRHRVEALLSLREAGLSAAQRRCLRLASAPEDPPGA